MIKKHLILLPTLFYCAFATAQLRTQTNNPIYNVISDSSGIHVPYFDFSINRLVKNKRWNGKWIWLNQARFAGYQKTNTLWLPDTSSNAVPYQALFRKKITLGSFPGTAVLFISGDVLYNVYVNGRFVGRGPVNIGSDYADKRSPGYWYYSSFDVKPFLKKGENIIAVNVFASAFEISATTSSRGRFICDLSLNNQPAALSTDGTWKCNLDTSFNNKGRILTYDANKAIQGWRNAGYDDSGWALASVVPKAGGKPLLNSQIPVPINLPLNPLHFMTIKQSQTAAVSGTDFFNPQKGENEFVLDFGKNTPAYISFSAICNKGDSIIVSPFEKLDYQSNRSFKYICRQGLNDYQTPNLSVFRYLKVKVYAKNRLTFRSFSADFSSYPVQYQGQFECSYPFFNELWHITRWTTQMCMNDMLYDSPLHQEPIGCTGDYFIESLNDYYAFGDAWLVRQNLIQTAMMLDKNDYKMFHTSYSLLWIQMMLKYYEYTGDKQLLTQLSPYVQKLLNRFESYLDKDYLLSNAPNYMFMDWIRINEFNAHHPPAVVGMGYLTMMYYKALKDGSAINQITGNYAVGRRDDLLSSKIKSALNRRLYVKEKGLYKDGIPFITKVKPGDWLPADKDLVTFSPHVNTLAVLYDIAPKNEQKALMNYVVTQKDYQLQPYFMSYVLAGLHHTDQIDEGLRQVGLWKNGIDTSTYTLKENWNDKTDDGYTGDYSHAWGGSPLLFLSQSILGISPAGPGFRKIKIMPYAGEKITFAKGAVPVGKNTKVKISWRSDANKTYIYNVVIPKEHSAEYFHPVEFRNWKISVNGKKVSYTPQPLLLNKGNYTVRYAQ
ncbi:MAG: alpha-L-rhamnosidase N-terminal domain-containing protein [Bacteroidota bacterium]|nr:alpha-L-rhamnosidase N-terminal domain-containing protein [Bacteroidota bacterium]